MSLDNIAGVGSVGNPGYEQVVHRAVGPWDDGVPESSAVVLRVRSSGVRPLLEVGELGAQDRCLESVETRTPTDDVVDVLGLPPVIPEAPHLGEQCQVVGDDGTPVTPGTEVLARVETETRCVAGGTDMSSTVGREVRLGCVLDHDEPASPPPVDRCERDDVAVQMDGDHRSGPIRPQTVDVVSVQKERPGIHIGEDRSGARVQNRFRSGDERHRGDDDLVSRTDSERTHRQRESVCS